jgi:hypothetical protein
MKPLKGDRIPVVLCGTPGVKTKILSTKKKEPWMQALIEVSRRAVEKCFFLDILSHRMSAMAIFQHLVVADLRFYSGLRSICKKRSLAT